MSQGRKDNTRRSYAGSHPDLKRGMSDRLKRTQPVTGVFEDERDPVHRAHLKSMRKTESQRREESGRGSLMVKLQRPFPELKPRHDYGVKRSRFNQDWLKEQRAAKRAMYSMQRTGSIVPQRQEVRIEPTSSTPKR